MSEISSSAGSAETGAIVMLAYADAEILDIAGPLDILCAAPCFHKDGFKMARQHKPLIVSEFGGAISTHPSGITIYTEPLKSIGRRKIDTLIIPGAYSMEHVLGRVNIIKWIQKMARRARRVVSVCTGAFLLGEAGLLRGRRVTTHWHHLAELALRFPDVMIEPDSIFVVDGNVYTSAGITSGMDLALRLVEEDWGSEKALLIARNWLLYARRPGGQSQFSALLPVKGTERETITQLKAWIMDNLNADLTVAILAERLSMSPRHFARIFQNETGITPARFVESVRIEAARRWLEQSAQSIQAIAEECGMGDPERLRRSFIRRLGVNPRDYRRRFDRHEQQNIH